jgi:DNA-directed RNA polymerase specialized sigma24 family protein
MADRRPAPESSRSQFGEIGTRRDLLGDAGALLERYGRAIRGYLLVILKDEDAAHDVLLAMRVKMMDGRFARWEPGQGRFRFYLKKAVHNEALQHLRKRRNRLLERQVEDLARFPAGGCGAEPDEIWLGSYRKALLEAAIKALRAYQEQHPGNVFHTLVGMLSGDLIADAAAVGDGLSDAELGERLGQATGQGYTLANVAQQKRRSRQKLAEFLASEVRATLGDLAPGDLEDELRQLGFLGFIANYLSRGKGTAEEAS